ncbi:class I SAM-dependent methyltransferase [candidate division WOR-3 bacterium]|nr:class I SAM-dependent methyltransferase [candidate division WOR-3 bacterium]
MGRIYDFILEGLDLRNKIILDAAVGSGECTYFWAERIDKQGGNSKIIAIDIDLPRIWKEKIKEGLGEYSKYVEFREADIFNLSFLEDESVDIVNCDDTVVFLNPKPLKLLLALKEVKRVLKPSGYLIITSEIPIGSFDNPEDEGQWRRWNLAKAIYDLKGKTWASEPLPEELKFVLQVMGFKVYAEKIFPTDRNFEYIKRGGLEEWKEIMLKDVEELPWSNHLKDVLRKEIDVTYNKIMKDGYLMNPAIFVLKCRGESNGK